jgi:protein phosphatase-4 regulatory subunit 3
VVPIADDTIRAKIHQTYRLLYLKDVILARVLDDPMFNILNSLLFFNQIDIITHIASNDRFLTELFSGFKEHKLKTSVPPGKPAATSAPEPLNEEDIKRRKDVVALLHQLMLMGKQVQLQHRQQLYRVLIERGLLFVCEWALKQEDSTVLNQVAEMLSIVIDHDVNAVRTHALREHAEKRKTITEDMTTLLLSSSDLGLKSQMADAIRTLVDIGGEGSEVSSVVSRAFGCLTLSLRPRFRTSSALSVIRPPEMPFWATFTTPASSTCIDLYSSCQISRRTRASSLLRSQKHIG